MDIRELKDLLTGFQRVLEMIPARAFALFRKDNGDYMLTGGPITVGPGTLEFCMIELYNKLGELK